MTDAIEAAGLMFTNVEADQSPTRQRGFQVWQASAGLSAEVKREITRRVDDYRVPVGTPPEAVAAFPRDAFFKVAGGFAVARTVPLAGKDKFGRGGRFFAHAFVVTAEDFGRVHSDPFALFDAAKFSADPERVKEWHPDWLKGVLPPTRLLVARSTAAQHPGPVRALLAGHLDREPAQRKTVVVVGKPADVAAELRTIYRGLPPELRAASEFDTLSAGASLTQVPCAFAGCPAADALKLWAFRRFARFDPAAGTLGPADPPPRKLPASLPGTAAWADAADGARAAAWDAAGAVVAGRPGDAAQALDADPGALAILETAPGFAAALEGLKEKWFAQCPTVVADVPGVREYLDESLAGPCADQLRCLRSEVPRGPLAEILLHQIGMVAYRGESPEDLGHIQAWHGKNHHGESGGRRLNWVLSRLRYRDADELVGVLKTGDDEDAEWFRTWVRDYTEAEQKTATTLLAGLAHDLADADVTVPVYDAGLYLHCQPNEPADVMRVLRFRHACRTGGLKGLDWCTDLPERAELVAYFRPRAVTGWTTLSDFKTFAGVFVYPQPDVVGDAELLDHLCHLYVDRFDPGVRGQKSLTEFAPETTRPRSGQPVQGDMDSKALDAFLAKIRTPKDKPRNPKKLDACRSDLLQSEVFFRECVGKLLGSLGRKSVVEPPGRPGEAALFGYRLDAEHNPNSKEYLPNLLDAVLAVTGGQMDREINPQPATGNQDRERLTWLLSWL